MKMTELFLIVALSLDLVQKYPVWGISKKRAKLKSSQRKTRAMSRSKTFLRLGVSSIF
jgi:hypothetical protein